MNPSGPRNETYSASLSGNSIIYLLYPDEPSATYNLAADEWTFFSPPNGITSNSRYFTAAVNESLLVFAPYNPQRVAKFTPRRPLFLYQKP